MNERPTQETDAEIEGIKNNIKPQYQLKWAIEVARKIERERDEAREQCKALWQLVEIEKKKTYNYRQERDEARQKMADSLQEVDLRTLDFERMKQERDEARGQWKEQHDALLTVMEHGENEMQKLIKERDEARELASGLAKQAERLRKERDEARRELNEIRAERDLARLSSMESDQTHDRMVGELEGVYKQLDEARERSAKLASQLLAEMEDDAK